MLARLILVAIVALLGTSCAETVRCPDGEIFDMKGKCIDIPDAGSDGS